MKFTALTWVDLDEALDGDCEGEADEEEPAEVAGPGDPETTEGTCVGSAHCLRDQLSVDRIT